MHPTSLVMLMPRIKLLRGKASTSVELLLSVIYNGRIKTGAHPNRLSHRQRPLPLPTKTQPEAKHTKEPPILDHVLMRSTSYRASETYYPHTITLLRLDRPNIAFHDEEVKILQEMLPEEGIEENTSQAATIHSLSVLQNRLQDAQTDGNVTLFQELLVKIAQIATNQPNLENNKVKTTNARLSEPHAALTKSINESLAFKTKVHSKTYADILKPAWLIAR